MVRRLFLLLLFLAPLLQAAPLRVGVTGEEPFVIWSADGAPPTGAAIDIWEKIATANTWTFEYTPFADLDSAVQAVADGKIDVLVGDVGIASSRLSQVEFSQPVYRSGLQIMISEARPHTVGRFLWDLKDLLHLQLFWVVVGAVVIFTIVVFFFERRHNPDFPKTKREGVVEAFYYVISLALTGKSVYKGFSGVIGRLTLVVWMLLGVITVAYVTSSITTAMTLEQLSSKIAGPQDLPGKTVAAVRGTAASEYLEKHGITRLEAKDLDQAVQWLLKGEVHAIVDEAPVLQVYDKSHPALPITEVGPIFSPENVGFAFAIGSTLRGPANRVILQLSESHTLNDIFTHYLGPLHQP